MWMPKTNAKLLAEAAIEQTKKLHRAQHGINVIFRDLENTITDLIDVDAAVLFAIDQAHVKVLQRLHDEVK